MADATRGRELLREWFERENRKRKLSMNELGRRVAVTPGVISRYLNGERVPELPVAVAIERETGVSVAEWVAPPERGPRRRLPRARRPASAA